MAIKYSVRDVFTPNIPATLSFVERDSLNARLTDALQTPGKQIVVYGHSGSGKSTVLSKKVGEVYETRKIVSRCTITTTYENLLLGAFDALDPFYVASASLKRTYSLKGTTEANYIALKTAIEASAAREEQVTANRMLPPQLTPQKLAEFCGAARCCWILEDFHKVPDVEKVKLSQIMKVFTDTAADYPLAKIIAVGAVDTARQVVEYDSEMRTRVAEIEVPMMTSTELKALLARGEELLNVRFGSRKEEIATYSSGLGAICHQIALYICLAAGVEHTSETEVAVTNEQMKGAVQRYVENSSDTLKATFDLALKRERGGRFDNMRLILRAMTEVGQNGATFAEILSAVRKEEADYPSGNLTTYLQQLQGSKRAAVLRGDATSGKFFFSDPLYYAFARCQFVPPRETKQIRMHLLGQELNLEQFLFREDKHIGVTMVVRSHGVKPRPKT